MLLRNQKTKARVNTRAYEDNIPVYLLVLRRTQNLYQVHKCTFDLNFQLQR